MGLFDSLFGNSKSDSDTHGIIENGRNKNTGGHDHRTNRGDDRTVSQKKATRKEKNKSYFLNMVGAAVIAVVNGISPDLGVTP